MSTIADIALNGLKQNSQWLRYYAKDTERYVAAIDAMPAFRTTTEAELDEAEQALKSALDKVRDVRAHIRPVQQLEAAE